MPRLYQGRVDRYEAADSKKEDAARGQLDEISGKNLGRDRKLDLALAHLTHVSQSGTPAAFDAWIFCRKPRPQARLRLFCFPYAGAGASFFALGRTICPRTLRSAQCNSRHEDLG